MGNPSQQGSLEAQALSDEKSAQELRAVFEVMDSVLREAKGKKGSSSGTAEAKLSIQKDSSGKSFVQIDRDILARHSRSEWAKTVRETLKKKFPHEIRIANNDISIDYQSRREMSFSKYAQWLMAHDESMLADKYRSADNADEILRVSQNYVSETLKHPRKDDISLFARGSVRMRVGQNDYSASVIVATRKNGQMILYDIIDLVPIRIETKNQQSPNIAYATAAGQSADTAIIPDSSKKGNVKFSLKPSSTVDAAALQKENEQLKKTVDALKAQMELTQGHHVTDYSLGLLAGKTLRQAGSTYSKKTGSNIRSRYPSFRYMQFFL